MLAYFSVFRSAPLSASPTPPPTGGDHILHESSLKYIKYSCVVFIQSYEKSVCAICIPDLISTSLEIAYLYTLAHFFQAGGKLFDKVHLDIEIYRQIGVLVSGIYRAPDVEIYVSRFFKKQAAYH